MEERSITEEEAEFHTANSYRCLCKSLQLMLLLVIGNGYSSVAECRSGYAAITTRIPKRYKAHIKRMLKRYKSQYTVMKSILIDMQRSN